MKPAKTSHQLFILPLLLFILTISPGKVFSSHSSDSTGHTIKAEKKWLLLPVKNGAQKKKMTVSHNGEVVREFEIELADENPDWYAYLDIGKWQHEELELRVNELDENSGIFTLIQQRNEEADKDTRYSEKYRGQIHFSPKRGWNNDPNGLVYFQGEYHLFFQHNPYGVLWGNMHWGHAVSKDLVHWEELGEALYPDKYGTIFSGSGVVDKQNSSGLGTAENPPIVVSYTYDSSWTQGLAYSQDGRSFTKLEHPILEKITDGNRDPKIIRHEPSGKWVMVLYVEKPGKQHTVHFYSSPDLKNWQLTSIMKGGIGEDRYLFECPDLYALPVRDQPGEKKWILSAANGEYAIGNFDGKAFHPETSRLKSMHGKGYYAAQTFTNDPQGRKIEIGWWQTDTDKGSNHFNQSMSIPMELELVKTPEGLRISRTPVEELKKLRIETHHFEHLTIPQDKTVPLNFKGNGPLEMRLDIQPGKTGEISVLVRGMAITYNINKEELTAGDVKARLPLFDDHLELTLFADRTGLEIFGNDGTFYMPVPVHMDIEKEVIELRSTETHTLFRSVDIYELDGIW
ncbi:DUF4980 domain-containing protein [Sinomicrobium sp. M5D2P17]